MAEMMYLGDDNWKCSICGQVVNTEYDLGAIYHDCKKEDVVESLASLVHDEWIEWSKDIASKEKLSEERLNRWKHYWIPYDELPEAAKASDRVWAVRAIEIAEKHGFTRRD